MPGCRIEANLLLFPDWFILKLLCLPMGRLAKALPLTILWNYSCPRDHKTVGPLIDGNSTLESKYFMGDIDIFTSDAISVYSRGSFTLIMCTQHFPVWISPFMSFY